MDLIAAYKHMKKEEKPLTCAAVILGAGMFLFTMVSSILSAV